MHHPLGQIVFEYLGLITQLDTEIILLVILLVIFAIVYDSLTAFAKSKRNDSGMEKSLNAIGIDGSSKIPGKVYVSDMQGLAGSPDALISENGFIIPVERKPLAKKIHDRYVAQLLVYMRLVEEFEGKRPPYGYLILGPKCRKFKIENTEARQAWLQKVIDDMRSILDGNPAKAEPHPRKCGRCDVRLACSFSQAQADVVGINPIEKQPILQLPQQTTRKVSR